MITLQMAREALALLDVDELGLDRVDRTILTTMMRKFDGRPVGLDTLAATTGEDAVMVTLPQWLEREKNTLRGTVTKMPAREDIDLPIEEHLIVELYSK